MAGSGHPIDALAAFEHSDFLSLFVDKRSPVRGSIVLPRTKRRSTRNSVRRGLLSAFGASDRAADNFRHRRCRWL